MKITIINGPNLNLVGIREPEIYGSDTFEDLLIKWRDEFPEINIEYFQSNVEGEIINKLHEIGFKSDGIILNAGGYSHTSVAIADAVASIKTPVIEVHISNIFSREEFRRHSLIAPHAKAVICGFGTGGYRLALIGIKIGVDNKN